jgi:hypothetical protein
VFPISSQDVSRWVHGLAGIDLVSTEDSMNEEQTKALIKAAVDDLHLEVRKELANARQAIANDIQQLQTRLEELEDHVRGLEQRK